MTALELINGGSSGLVVGSGDECAAALVVTSGGTQYETHKYADRSYSTSSRNCHALVTITITYGSRVMEFIALACYIWHCQSA